MEERYEYTHDIGTDPDTGLTLIQLACENSNDPSRSIRVAVAPEYGSNLIRFDVGEKHIFHTDTDAVRQGLWTGCFVLWPLPNRYDREGRKEYEFEGRVVSLEDIVRKEGNSSLIHGLVDDQVWEYEPPVVQDNGVRLRTRITIDEQSPLYRHFPYSSELTLDYRVFAGGVEVTYTARNRDTRNMPSVFALHPYYSLLGGSDRTLVRVPARSVMRATDELLPTGELMDVEGTEYDLRAPGTVKGMRFDHVWTDLEGGQFPYVEYEDQGIRVSHVTSPDCTHVVLYTFHEEDLGFICLEPQTGSTNAINLHARAIEQHDKNLEHAAHLMIVAPGESHTGSVTFLVEFLQ